MAKLKNTDFRYFGYKNSYIINDTISVINNAFMLILLSLKYPKKAVLRYDAPHRHLRRSLQSL